MVVGRGIDSEDNIEEAVELAEALGGAVAASRPIVDQGWLPKTRQVGKSGLTVNPLVYLALGVSGAPEHVEGMRDASTIIAINTDPQAPIFGVAHYGWVGDLFDLLPGTDGQAGMSRKTQNARRKPPSRPSGPYSPPRGEKRLERVSSPLGEGGSGGAADGGRSS